MPTIITVAVASAIVAAAAGSAIEQQQQQDLSRSWNGRCCIRIRARQQHVWISLDDDDDDDEQRNGTGQREARRRTRRRRGRRRRRRRRRRKASLRYNRQFVVVAVDVVWRLGRNTRARPAAAFELNRIGQLEAAEAVKYCSRFRAKGTQSNGRASQRSASNSGFVFVGEFLLFFHGLLPLRSPFVCFCVSPLIFGAAGREFNSICSRQLPAAS